MKPAGPRWAGGARLLAGLALLAYPLLVWGGLASASPRRVALCLAAALVPAVLARRRGTSVGGLAFLPLVTLGLLTLAGWLDHLGLVLVVPVAVNATLLAVFGLSLRPGARPLIESFARLEEPELTEAQRAWCRLWTLVWCAFFVLNGATAALLAWLAPLSWWALYTGGLAYGAIGALIGLERLLRARRFPRGEAS